MESSHVCSFTRSPAGYLPSSSASFSPRAPAVIPHLTSGSRTNDISAIALASSRSYRHVFCSFSFPSSKGGRFGNQKTRETFDTSAREINVNLEIVSVNNYRTSSTKKLQYQRRVEIKQTKRRKILTAAVWLALRANSSKSLLKRYFPSSRSNSKIHEAGCAPIGSKVSACVAGSGTHCGCNIAASAVSRAACEDIIPKALPVVSASTFLFPLASSPVLGLDRKSVV